jgi:hypothetical protein
MAYFAARDKKPARSAGGQLRLAAHLSRWLAGEGVEVAALTPAVVAEFLAARRAAGYTAYRWLGQRAGGPVSLRETGALRRLRHVFDAADGYRADEAAVERREGLLNRASRGR